MGKMLEELYMGTLYPHANIYRVNLHMDKVVQVIEKNETELTATLSGQEKRLFVELLDAHCRFNEITSSDSFRDGFCLGTKLMIEVMNE